MRIPAEFRRATVRVRITRTSQGDLIRNRPPQVAERIDQLADDDRLAMSFITWAELLRGAEGSHRPRQGGGCPAKVCQGPGPAAYGRRSSIRSSRDCGR